MSSRGAIVAQAPSAAALAPRSLGRSDARIQAVNPRIRLLAVDIDGTLLDSRFQISPANQAALRRASQAGVEIVLVTGRRHSFALPIARQLEVPLAIISSNGAITRPLEGDLFHRHLLPRPAALALCAHMKEFRSALVLTFEREDRGALVLESFDGFTGAISRWMQMNREFIECVQPIEQSLVTDPIQAMFCGSVARMQAALAHLRSGAVASDVHALRTEYPRRDLAIVDVLAPGCSKGAALERWAHHRGYGRHQVMAIGDNYNDVEMLEFAGLPVIMGNASQELQQNGWARTASNDESGVAAAVEQFIDC